MNNNLVLKKCNNCNLEFPKTKEFFYEKVIKQKNKKGVYIYYSFRHNCKSCTDEKKNKNRIKKRCKEMDCDISQYRDFWKKQYSKTRTSVFGISHLPRGVQQVIRRKVKNGYIFTNYEQYRIDCRKNISKVKRKYEYGNIDFVPKGVQRGIIFLTDSYIAMCLKSKVKEVPKEMIELKKLTIQLKRELEKLKTI